MTEQERNPEAILACYAGGPAQLESAISGLKESELDLAQSSDSWSMLMFRPRCAIIAPTWIQRCQSS